MACGCGKPANPLPKVPPTLVRNMLARGMNATTKFCNKCGKIKSIVDARGITIMLGSCKCK